MRDLPGFYFDEEKKRYFPISSIPKHLKSRSNTPNTQVTSSHVSLQKFQNVKCTLHDSLLKQKHATNRISRSNAAQYAYCLIYLWLVIKTCRSRITSAQLVRASLTRTIQHPDSNTPFLSFCVCHQVGMSMWLIPSRFMRLSMERWISHWGINKGTVLPPEWGNYNLNISWHRKYVIICSLVSFY